MTITATAPGKLVLFGEYAVLEGAPALVAAVEARAQATFTQASCRAAPLWHVHAPTLNARITLEAHGHTLRPLAGAEVPPSLRLAVAIAADHFARSSGALPPGTLTLDTQAFYAGSTKLGLGSSGAITIALWHALAVAAAQPSMGPQTILAMLRGLHSGHQGGTGSGVDLAASLMGGIVRYQLNQAEQLQPEVVGALSATYVRPLQGLYILPMWTGKAAHTGPLLQQFAAFKQADPKSYWRICEEMAMVSRAACELWALTEVAPLLPLVSRATHALETLGRAMGQDLVTDIHRQAAATAQAYGAVYKPSGAGGGDFGLLFAMSERSLNKASRALVAQGLTPWQSRLYGQGVSVHKKD